MNTIQDFNKLINVIGCKLVYFIGTFAVGIPVKNSNRLDCYFSDGKSERCVTLIFKDDELVIEYETQTISYQWQKPFTVDFLLKNVHWYADHLNKMLITGFDSKIKMDTFDSFTIIDTNEKVENNQRNRYGTKW